MYQVRSYKTRATFSDPGGRCYNLKTKPVRGPGVGFLAARPVAILTPTPRPEAP